MSEVQGGTSARPPRRASAESIIAMLNQRLDEKANHIRRLEDNECVLAAVIKDLEEELDALRRDEDSPAPAN